VKRSGRGTWAAVLVALLAALPAAAQEEPVGAFPARPIRIVVGYAPGGANDILARLVGQKMAESLGQPVVVENKPGAQAIIAAELVARSRPDGYTLLMGASGPIVFNPITYAKLPYDPVRDFAPVSMVGSFPLILIVGAKSGFRTLADLVAFARANPAKANYGSSAASFQLATELLKQRSGTSFVHIPYKGSAESVNAVAAGDVTMALVDSGPASIALKGGQARGLAVTSPRRLPGWPDIPTFAEAGIGGLEVELWSGLLAPAGTPAPIVARLQQEVARAVAAPDVTARMDALAIQPVASSPDDFGKAILAELEQWRAVAKAADLKPE
jgi:tripartite-type tricarboxylate transporter receptor subunit TctC